MKLITVLTARMDSSRLPGKTKAKIAGKPLLYWIIRRLKKLPGMVVLAAPDDEQNQALIPIADEAGVNVFFGSRNDVVTRVDDAIEYFQPDSDYILRGLGDCPFLDIDIVKRSLRVMDATQSDAFLWHLDPQTWPVYGAREFPFSIAAWRKINSLARGAEREHVDLFFHNNRSKFKIVYHEPPESTYFRPYRLEVDWPEDVKLVRVIANQVGMTSSLPEIINFLDSNPAFPKLNRERVEKTGPTASYEYSRKRQWMREMRGKPYVRWDDTIMHPPDDRATPVFCSSGKCSIGFGWEGTLFTDKARIVGEAWVECRCGAGKYWNKPK